MTLPNHDARLVDLAPTGLVIFGQIFARFGHLRQFSRGIMLTARRLDHTPPGGELFDLG
jgi:hypothetical protein